MIQFVVAVYAITVDVEHRPSLVSADPNVFLAEVSMVAGQSFLTVSNDYRPKADRSVQGDLSAAPLDDVESWRAAGVEVVVADPGPHEPPPLRPRDLRRAVRNTEDLS